MNYLSVIFRLVFFKVDAAKDDLLVIRLLINDWLTILFTKIIRKRRVSSKR
jgi:hypothetical protein